MMRCIRVETSVEVGEQCLQAGPAPPPQHGRHQRPACALVVVRQPDQLERHHVVEPVDSLAVRYIGLVVLPASGTIHAARGEARPRIVNIHWP